MASVLLFYTVSPAATVIDVKGHLLPPACRVHDGNAGAIQVDFGDDININRLDGINYQQRAAYTVTCDKDGQQWPMQLTFAGLTAAWDSRALATTDENLAIRLTLDGQEVAVGVPFPVKDSVNLPVLMAVPIKNAATPPDEGVFSATASLLAEYH